MCRLACVVWFVCLFFGCVCLLARAAQSTFDYRVLATNKTSTMEKEMNEAADAGFVFGAVMGGETAGGGKEVVVVMVKDPSKAQGDRRVYKLLATSKTSTMQKEMQQQGLYRWGATYVPAAQMDELKKAQEKINANKEKQQEKDEKAAQASLDKLEDLRVRAIQDSEEQENYLRLNLD